MPDRALLKVCGAVRAADLELLAGAGADLVGLWHGVPGGHAELDSRALRALAAVRGEPRPVLVTLEPSAAVLDRVLTESGVSAVQLHGYQPPGVVRALKRAEPCRLVIKVLHLHGTRCPERPLLGAYERAGVDLVLFDPTASDGRVGSTGRHADPAALLALAREVDLPFLVAGGVRPGVAGQFSEVRALPGFAGVDVDSGVRDLAGALDAGRVRAVRQEWSAAAAA
ncbi:hypothetical protein AB0H12_44160 [Actinosynnema sp. NPDC023794]